MKRTRRTLREFGVQSTFFTPRHTALSYPSAAVSLSAEVHEIGHHGWVHDVLSRLSEQQERSDRAGAPGARVIREAGEAS